VSPFGTAVALALALLVQTALGRLAPGQVAILDPFLLVVVYSGLTRGELHGMLAGTMAGWIQDIQFGGPVSGLSALTKLLLGFGVGAAGSRFLLVGPGPRLLVLVTASLADALLLERLAAMLGVPVAELTLHALLTRAAVNALVGALLFHLLDKRLRTSA